MLLISSVRRILCICLGIWSMSALSVSAQNINDPQVLEQISRAYKGQANTPKNVDTDVNETRLRGNIKQETDSSSVEESPVVKQTAVADSIFGRQIFSTNNLTFEPNMNMATPPNYRLGPGDEVIIDIWGASQNTIRQQITPDGTINISMLGPVFLSGMTVNEANVYMKKALNKIYSGVNDGNEQTSGILLTLGSSRTIQINVMGEVVQPGTYTLSSFSTVFHALYRAGGVSGIGSLRKVQLMRAGKVVTTVDVYDFIMKGKVQDDIRLEEGDVIIVHPYDVLAKLVGNVKRPMKYEMKNGESLAALIHYAGGFNADAYTRSLQIVRQNGEEYEINTVGEDNYPTYEMRNGDVVTAGALLNRFTNRLEIRGAVYRPGVYQLSGRLNTVCELVKEARGLMGDAFPNRALLQRKRENLTSEMIRVDILNIVKGSAPDIALQKDDILYIPSIHDLEDRGEVTIHGEVKNPDAYPYIDNLTLEDLIIQAGGLREAASTVCVDVARRIKDPKSSFETDSIGQMFRFALKDGFVIEGEEGFVLKPYDHVYVRRSPGYQVQQNVTLEGEVLFSGVYAMTDKEERLSYLITKAGGVTKKAYLRGANLIRKANADEKKRMQRVVNLMTRQLGEGMMDSLNIVVEDFFAVGISLDKALASPGCEDDIILREGDVIAIPKYNNTVKVNGSVMMPNTVAYLEGKNINYYLNQAGGYNDYARKRKKFIIYMNGQISKVKGDGRRQIEPGCEIIIPNKKAKKAGTIGKVFEYATSFSSLGMMMAALANLLK